MRLILASKSPRRKELLESLGVSFTVESAVGEEIYTSNMPGEIVQELARNKAQEVQKNHQNEAVVILGSDTIVVYKGKILTKPANEKQAKEMLQLLSGSVHQVYTGVVLLSGVGQILESFYESTEVEFYPISDSEIDAYIKTGEPMDKAGAYGIQGRGSLFVKSVCGSYQNVVGLPTSALYQKLKNREDLDVSIR